jgi:Ca2+-binding RTX toxin-like protein
MLAGLAFPAGASALMFIRVEQDSRTGQKRVVIDSGLSDNAITVNQETQGDLPALGITVDNPNEGFVIGQGCNTARNPPRGRCNTAGVTSISMNLRAQDAPPGSRPDTNSVDLSGVTQLTPDGSEPLPVTIVGGTGPDTIVDVGDRRLTASTGEGNDVINGGPRNDDIDEGPGNDIVLGGDGNDRFGDFHTPDSDIISGGAGRDQVVGRGVVTLGDLLCNDGANADAPTGALGVPRAVNAPEGRLECSGTGADRDLFAGIEGVAQAFDNSAVDFTGSGADERLQGQQGSDRFEGGGGRDSILGFEGNDLVLGRDNGEDARLDCGEGGGDDDRAVVDAVDPVEPNCETIERGRAELPGPVGGGAPVPPLEGFRPAPPPSPPLGNQPSSGDEGNQAGGGDNGRTPPQLEIPTRVAFVRRNRIQIRVRCVYRAKNCKGTLTLRAAQSKRAGKRRVRKGARLARGRVNVPWGTSKATTMRAPRSLVRLMRALRGRRTLKVRATVVAKDSGAGRRARSARRSRTVVLGLQR